MSLVKLALLAIAIAAVAIAIVLLQARSRPEPQRLGRLSGGPLKVNGEIPGQIWWSSDAEGSVKLMRVTGEEKTFPVHDAWIRTEMYGGLPGIEIGARAIPNDRRPLPWWFPELRGSYDPDPDGSVFLTDSRHFTVHEPGKPEAKYYELRQAYVWFREGSPMRADLHHMVYDADGNLINTIQFGADFGGAK